MDYDGNDFEGSQPLITGEGSSRFSSVLHPYALPKFDFDDGFHSHLRFDSLVENEVFLGIPSQEDNHWIETFPRGSSGTEFSSSAPESCSFSRHNDVWSEATSSESVEMLLKSLGQEEVVGGETIVEESDVCDGGGLTKLMDPQLHQDVQDEHLEDPGCVEVVDGETIVEESGDCDGSGLTKLMDPQLQQDVQDGHLDGPGCVEVVGGETVVEESDDCDGGGSIKLMDPQLQQDVQNERLDDQGCVEVVGGENIVEESDDCGGLSKFVDPQLQQDVQDECLQGPGCVIVSNGCQEHSNDVESTSLSQEAEVSQHKSSLPLDKKSSTGICGVVMSENDVGFERKSVDVTRMQVWCTMNESSDNTMQTESSGPEMQIEEIEPSARDNLASIKGLNNGEVDHKLFFITSESTFQSSQNSGKEIEGHHVPNVEIDAVDEPTQGNAVGSNHNLVDETCSSKTDSIEQTAIEPAITDLQGVSSLTLRGDLEVQMTEGYSQNQCSTDALKDNEPQQVDLSDRAEVLGGSGVNFEKSLISISEGNCNDQGKCIDVSTTSEGSHDNSELKVDQTTEGVNSSSEGRGCLQNSEKLDSHASGAKSEASIISRVEDKPSDGQRDSSCSKYVRVPPPSTVTCSSTEFVELFQTLETVESLGFTSAAHKEDAKAERGLTQNNTTQSNPIDQPFVQDGTLSESESVRFMNNNKLNSEFVESLRSSEKVGPSSDKECTDVRDAAVHVYESINTERNNPALGAITETTNLRFQDSVGAAPSTVDQGAIPLDKKYKTGNEDLADADLLLLKEGLGEQSGLGPMMQPGRSKGVHLSPIVESFNSVSGWEQSADLLNKPVDQSFSVPESSTTDRESEQATNYANNNEDSPEKLKVCTTAYNLAVKDRGNGEELVIQDKALDAENDVDVTSLKTAGFFKSICGKNSAPDCNVLSNEEKVGEEAKGSRSKSYPLSEVTSQSTQILVADDGSKLLFEVNPSAVLLEKQTTKEGEPILPTQVCQRHMIAAEILLEPSVECPRGHNGDASAGSIKPTNGNVTVSSCTTLCGSEDNEKGSKGPTCQSSPLSEVTIQPYPAVIGNDAGKDDRSFGFKLHPSAGLSEKHASKHECEPHTKQLMKTEGSSEAPSASQKFSETHEELSHRRTQAPHGEIVCGTSKGAPERKRKRVKGGTSEKVSSNRGSPLQKTTSVKQTKRDQSCNVSVGGPVTSQLVQLDGLKPYASVTCSGLVTGSVISVPTSNLPDLNTSAPLLYQQPFTDTQQVQLRSQIIVYGSLIQGAAPDEAFMVSAFGASDGGRSVWEPSWHACLKRVQCQKSHTDHLGTPKEPLSGARPSGKLIKQDGRQSKVSVSPSPNGQAGGNAATSAAASSTIPLSSPLWNMSTPDVLLSRQPRSGLDRCQSVSPLHSFQTPAPSLLGCNTSSQYQTSFPGPWISSAKTSVCDSGVRFPLLPMSMLEAVKLTPVRGLSSSVSHELKHSSLVHEVHSTRPAFLAVNASLHDIRMAELSGTVSTDRKARKRKNVMVSEDLHQFSLVAQPRTESVSIPVVTCHLSTSVVVSTPDNFVSKSNTNKIVGTVATASSTNHLRHEEHNNGQKDDIALDTSNKVEESKKQAEDAAVLAAGALSHSHNVWSQLDKYRSSGLVADAEAKLASAAVAVAAAASVAKAAAAAAKIASNIALHAKLMADEVSKLTETSNPTQVNSTSFPEVSTNSGKATPVSLFKCGDVSSIGNSVIGAAKEAVRRRVEAASAAIKHAENVDSIVKTAELAAEAVTQAGKIVAMVDPLPLNELIAAGQDGYWRMPLFSEKGVVSTSDNGLRAKADKDESGDVPCKQVGEGSLVNGNTISCNFSHRLRKVSSDSMDDCMKKDNGASSSLTIRKEDVQRKVTGEGDWGKTMGAIPESEFVLGCASQTVRDENENGVRTSSDKRLKEGCLVEVCRDGDDGEPAWFSASVLSLKDGKAFVCYTEIEANEDSGKLKEWVVIEDEGAKSAPRIRIAHPMTTIRFEGTRKRRRDAMMNYVWSVGDRVDVWTQSCWREAVVTEKNREDETSLTVQFPAKGATSIVKVWNLRPTLLWKNRQWIEWSISREKDPSYQGDTPKEKRKKLGIPALEGVEKYKTSKGTEVKDSVEPAGKSVLPLSANKKTFNAGKSMLDQHRPTVRGALRTGLKKEHTGVIFGVPKPGNKPKFMDVSKQYAAERNRTTVKENDSVKFAKRLAPQGAGSQGWRNPTTPLTKMSGGKLPPSRIMSASEVKKKLNNDEPGSLTSELSEPRRSNRKTKPTSKLLEGIQSSLMTPKTLPASHDKSHRTHK